MTQIYHAHLYGTRDSKYDWLQTHDVLSTDWQELKPQAPFYLLIPQNTDLLSEYDQGWKITDVMPVNSTGIRTHRDHFAFDFEIQNLRQRIIEFRDLAISDESIVRQYELTDTRDWKLTPRRRSLATNLEWQKYLIECLYRPFDIRAYYHHQDVVELPRHEVMKHMLNSNLGFHICRQVISSSWQHILVTNQATDDCYVSNKTRERGYTFPLYLYPVGEATPLEYRTELTQDRRSNFSPQFLKALTTQLGHLPSPEAIFYYIYAVLHSPTYRSRYAEFLKIDFPRVPLTSRVDLFQQLATHGEALVNLHLMKSPGLEQLITQFEGSDRTVDPGHPKYANGKVTINKRGAGFTGVHEAVWNFYVGGYQVCHKWLKDRKGRTLSPEDITHYQRIVVALQETIRLMQQIDAAIPGWPIQ